MSRNLASKKRQSHPALILDQLRRIVRALRLTSRDAEKEVGVTAAQLFILQRLREKSPMSLKEVAAATLTDSSTVSTVVQHLVKKGLVARVRSTADRRSIELQLTDAGHARLKQGGFRSYQEVLTAALYKMHPARQQALAELLGEVCERSGVLNQRLTMFFEEENKGSLRISRR